MAAKGLLLLFGLSWVPVLAQDQTTHRTADSLKAEIEKLKPEKLAWREIRWLNCPLEALKQSREQKKPIMTWVFLGNPTDERC